MSDAKHQLLFSESEDHTGILLIAQYCGLKNQLDSSQASQGIELTTSDGQKLTSFTSICRYLASTSARSHQLLGATPLERALVRQFAP